MLVGSALCATYQDIDILAQRAVGVRFDDFLQRAARVQRLWHFRNWGRVLRRCLCVCAGEETCVLCVLWCGC